MNAQILKATMYPSLWILLSWCIFSNDASPQILQNKNRLKVNMIVSIIEDIPQTSVDGKFIQHIKNPLKPDYCDLVKRSNLYSLKCNTTSLNKPRPLLITGIGRTGTLFLQTLLFKLNLNVRHDAKDNITCKWNPKV